MIYFNGTEGDFDALLKAEVGHQIMLRADTAEELDSLKKATRKAAKELKMRLRFEKDEHRVELGTRPKTEGLWHNSRGHYGYARITSREVPISAPSLTRPRGWNVDYTGANDWQRDSLDLAEAGGPQDGFRPPSSGGGPGEQVVLGKGSGAPIAATGSTPVLLGNATWYVSRSGEIQERGRNRSALAEKLGRQLRPDEYPVVDDAGNIHLASRGW